MEDQATPPLLIPLSDGAAHARVLAQQLALCVGEIATRYPNNKLGGLVQRLQQLATFSQGHAAALTGCADSAMRDRPELAAASADQPIAAPKSVLAVFEQAEVLTSFLSVEEAEQVASTGKLVVLRDQRAQSNHLVPKGAVIFDGATDRDLVRLWWPRIFSREMNVAILPTTVEGVWLETTYAPEDLPIEEAPAK